MTAASHRGAVCIVGGAGFIGSHFVDRLLADDVDRAVTVYDNFSSGPRVAPAPPTRRPATAVVKGDVRDLDDLVAAMAGHDTVIHLASNPDIARAADRPGDRLRPGHAAHPPRRRGCPPQRRRAASSTPPAAASTATSATAEAGGGPRAADPGLDLRRQQARRRGAASPPTAPCSASPRGAFRFGNVVGPRQTHGVGFDFVRRLLDEPDRLRILGDGTQSKSYIHVDDVVERRPAVAHRQAAPFAVFNVATGDYITVTEIAELAVEVVGLPAGSTPVRLHRRRPRLEGRRADRPPQHRPHPRAGLDEQPDCGERRCGHRWNPCSPTHATGGSAGDAPPRAARPYSSTATAC